MGRKVSDEWTVPLCATRHRALHTVGVNGGAKWGHGAGMKWVHLAVASLSAESTGGPRARRGVH